MAVTKTIIKNTNSEVVVRVSGTAGNTTIALSDLTASTQVAYGGSTPLVVSIVGAGWTGLLGSSATVARGGVNLITQACENSNYIEFDGQCLPPETTNKSSDIVVTIAGAEAQIWLKLRKVSGWQTKIENEQYGAYDDPARVGAYTNVNGSPDFTG